MASEQEKAASSSEDEVSDAGSTESSPLVSDVELAFPEGETSLEHRFFRQRREIAWRWTWLKLQCTDLRRQDKKCEETLARLREQKGRLEPLPLENDEETHALRTTGITPPKQNRKLIKRPPDVGQIRNPFQEAAAHTLFSLKPPVVKKAPEKKNPLTASSASVASVATTATNTSPDDPDQSSEAQHSISVDHVPTVSVSGGAEAAEEDGEEEEEEEEEEEDFYGEFYASDDSEEKTRPRSHKRSSRGGDDDATTPRRKMSRSVDFELPDTKALTASSGRSRRGLRASDWDVNNIVVPVSIASPRALQIVKPREIVTPGWKSSKDKEQREGQGEVRLIDEDAPAPKRADGAASSSSENTADELYATRHTPHEKAERARWEPLALQKKRLQQEAANQQPNDFIVTGEFDQMQSGGKGGKGAPRRLDFGGAPAPRSHKKGGSSHAHSSGGGGGGGSHAGGGGGVSGGGNSRRMRPSRAGLYWMRSRFYADLKWELVRREGQAETVFVFRHVNGPIPHPPDRGAGGLKRNSVSDIVMEEDDEVEVTIRHRNPVPLSQATVAPVVPPPPTEPDPELAEAPYSPSRVGGDGLQMSANLSLSLASSVADATMAEAEAEELEMHDAQLERSGDVDIEGEGEGEGDIRPEESRTFEEEEGEPHGKRGDGEGEEEGASPRQRAWAVRSMLNGVSEDSDVTIKVRSGASAAAAAAAKDSAASVSATATPAAAKTPAAAGQHAAVHTTD